jgi:DNA-binding LytR/AlgR family response regulator
MFIELLTTKKECVLVNVDKILYFAKTKKGVAVVFDDGMSVDVENDYNQLTSQVPLSKIEQVKLKN